MNKIGKIFIFIGGLLVLNSIFIFIRNSYEDYDAGKKSLEIVNDIKNIVYNDLNVVNNDIKIDIDGNDMIVTKVDNYAYIGLITIPSLNLELPVMDSYSDDKLRIAPVKYYGSIYTNDLIICAHSYKSHFGYLNKLEQKDKVLFTDISGDIFIYEILSIEVLDSDDIIEMIDNEFDLTLYTCTSDGKKRITVRCNRISEDIKV